MKVTAAALLFPLAVLFAPALQARRYMSIDALMKAHGKLYFGTATDQGRLSSGHNAALIQAEFGQVTPENSMKWASTEPSPGVFTFGGSDYLVKWALKHHKSIRGHTFLWHGQVSDWVSKIKDKAQMRRALENHITTVMTRYKGKVRAYDVANEIFNEDGSLRPSLFYNVLGEDMVPIAFRAARRADPAAKLYINDYNLNSPNSPKLTRGMVAHVKKWLAQGVPIDGIGTQGHIGAGQGAELARAIAALARSGVKEVAVTELDIPGNNAKDYATIAKGCVAVKRCVGVTVWGVRDMDSWLGHGKQPLLFDNDWRPKDAYRAIAKALS